MARTVKQQSIDHEEYLARSYGGRRTRNSGAPITDKGDVVIPEFVIQAKSTEGNSISINRKTIAKAKADALMRGRRPAIALRFEKTIDSPREDWIMFQVNDDIELRVDGSQ